MDQAKNNGITGHWTHYVALSLTPLRQSRRSFIKNYRESLNRVKTRVFSLNLIPTKLILLLPKSPVRHCMYHLKLRVHWHHSAILTERLAICDYWADIILVRLMASPLSNVDNRGKMKRCNPPHQTPKLNSMLIVTMLQFQRKTKSFRKIFSRVAFWIFVQ